MRWIWIDRIVELVPARRCVAVKCVSAAEEVLHDHFPATEHHPATPVMPNPLVIEGMAQTAGILVGHAGGFREKVILAKIAKARFTAAAWPGSVIRYTAEVERLDASGASTRGTVELLDPTARGEGGDGKAEGADAAATAQPMGEIDLMFSHIDQNRAGAMFPEENFVFTDPFFELLRRSGVPVPH